MPQEGIWWCFPEFPTPWICDNRPGRKPRRCENYSILPRWWASNECSPLRYPNLQRLNRRVHRSVDWPPLEDKRIWNLVALLSDDVISFSSTFEPLKIQLLGNLGPNSKTAPSPANLIAGRGFDSLVHIEVNPRYEISCWESLVRFTTSPLSSENAIDLWVLPLS